MLYNEKNGNKEYKNDLYKMVSSIKAKYGLSSNYNIIMKEKIKPFEKTITQMKLF